VKTGLKTDEIFHASHCQSNDGVDGAQKEEERVETKTVIYSGS
jgi:hypothetical protein